LGSDTHQRGKGGGNARLEHQIGGSSLTVEFKQWVTGGRVSLVRACLKREAVRKGSRRVGQRRRLSLLKGGVMEKVGGALWRHAGKGREGGGGGRRSGGGPGTDKGTSVVEATSGWQRRGTSAGCPTHGLPRRSWFGCLGPAREHSEVFN
jgi:hypothetical protein